MFKTIARAWSIPELRKKLLFTLLIVVIFRFGSTALLVPHVNVQALNALFDAYSTQGNLLSYLNVLTGGALANATLFAMSITPYINASIIIQLLTIAIPALEKLSKEGGEEGRKKIAAITRYSTIVIALISGFTYYIMLRRTAGINGESLLLDTSFWAAVVIIASFTAGSSIVMWLGEQISEHGIGNGISMLLFVGIIARIPSLFFVSYSYLAQGGWYIAAIIVALLILVAMIFFVVMGNDAERRIPVQYAKRMMGRKMYGGQSTTLPMKVSMSGVLPVIFASTILMFPGTIIAFFNPAEGTFWHGVMSLFNSNNVFYIVLYLILIFGFAYFYSVIQFNPVEVANNLKKNGGFVTGYRPGKPTSDFIARVLNKITFIGAAYLAIIAIVPVIFGAVTGITALTIGGTSLMIVVGVALETAKDLEAQMMMRHYKGFLE